MSKSTDDRIEDLTRSIEKLVDRDRGGSKSSSASPDKVSGFDQAIGSASSTLNEKFTKGIGVASEAYNKLKDVITNNMGMWQDLSKTGMSFSGDLVGMTIAAKGMRMETKDMVEILQKNSEQLVGFGSNMTRSAESFAQASKAFFDNNAEAADGLRRMGYTTKDLNEVMMLQGITVRGAFKDEQERNAVLAENAATLAKEMDLQAKLTGKSRQEQMENMKKQQADMQFEAALRLKLREIDDPVKKAEFEANARQQLEKAQREGFGDAFKQIYATGNVYTKEAANQAVLLREQFGAVRDAAKSSADTTLTSAERKKKVDSAEADLRAAQIKDANDVSKLQFRAMGSLTGVGDTLNQNAEKNNVTVRNMESAAIKFNETAKAGEKIDINTREGQKKAYDLALKEAEKAAKGQNAAGEQVDGTTKAMVQLEARVGDVSSALYDKLAKPLNKEVSDALGNLADSALRARGNLLGVAGPNVGKQTAAQLVGEQAEIGRKTDKPQNIIQEVGAVARLGEKGVNWLNNDAPGIIKEVGQKVDQITGKVPKREQGTLAMTGQIFENYGPGTLMELHGIETVMRPKDLMELSKNQMEGMMRAIPKSGVLDLDKMKKDAISFSTSAGKDKSSTVGEAKKQLNEIKELGGTSEKEIDRKSLKFDQFGMPITSGIKYKANEMSAEVQKKEEEKKAAASNVEDMKKGIAAGKPAAPEEKKPEVAKPAPSTSKESSLSDVVASLNQLNSKVSQLIDVQKDIGQRQIKAVKSNSKDVYNQ